MSDENKDALTPVKKKEETGIVMNDEEDKLAEELRPNGLMQKGFNKIAGSPFEDGEFGDIARWQLLKVVCDEHDKMDTKDLKSFILTPIKIAKRASTLLKGIAPQDQIEGMLAIQMIGIHYATMEALAKARSFKDPDIKNSFLNSSAKLSRTFAAQMEALNRHRGKGQQKMTVEHVHVNAGGQAIIGTVQSHGKKKKDVGEVMGGKGKK